MYGVDKDFLFAVSNNARSINAYFIYEGKKYEIHKLSLTDDIYTESTFIGTFIAKNGSITINQKDALLLENQEIEIFVGVRVKDAFKYIPMGKYKIYECVSSIEYKIIDYRYKFNIPFDASKVAYPTNPMKLLAEACNQAGVGTNVSDLINKDITINDEVFFGYDATCSDVIMAVAQATCCFAKINRLNQLEMRWFKKAEFQLQRCHQKDELSKNDKFGPINTVVLAREPQQDNVYYPTSNIEEKEVIKIANNPFLDLDREKAIIPLYDRLKNFKYIPFKTTTQGYFHIDSGDILTLELRDGTYIDAYILNHSLEYNGGIQSIFETPALSKTQIDYNKASSIERSFLETELKVDKIKGEIDANIKQLNLKLEKLNIENLVLHVMKSGSLLNHEIKEITLRAQLMENNQDITDTLSDISVNWYRVSKNLEADKEWNIAHRNKVSILIGHDDIDISASFQCMVMTGMYTLHSNFETISDEIDIPRLSLQFDTNLPITQTYNKNTGEMIPNWNPLLITPILWDGLLEVPLQNCSISWRRMDGELQSGELIENGILKVIHNKLSEIHGGKIVYICEIQFKTQKISNQITFSLLNDGVNGTNGENGKSLYTWIRYADDEHGTNMSDTPENKKFMGIAYNRSEENESDEPADYTWSLMQGEVSMFESLVAPENKDILWFDLNISKLKRYNKESEVWEIINDNFDDIISTEQRILETYESVIKQTKEEINLQISNITDTVGDTTEQIKGLQNEVKLTKDQISFIQTSKDELQNLVDGKIDAIEVQKYMRWDGDTLELGKTDSPFKAVLSNTELSFWQGNMKVAWVSNNELHIANSVIMEVLRVGNWQCKDEGSAGLTWRRI